MGLLVLLGTQECTTVHSRADLGQCAIALYCEMAIYGRSVITNTSCM